MKRRTVSAAQTLNSVIRSMEYAPTIRLADLAKRTHGADAGVVPRRIRALLNVAGGQILRGHTLHIGVDRLIVSVPISLGIDAECAIFFGLTIENQIFSIIGKGLVINCTGNESDGYHAEMHFKVEDKKSRIALEQLFSTANSNRVQ
jgi:hypothetical protein